MQALYGTELHGNIIGLDNENAFARRLHEFGVLNADRLDKGNDVSDLGRKWRSGLTQLGFLTPKITRSLAPGDSDPKLNDALTFANFASSGRPFEITPNGARLMKAVRLIEQQRCFLRSLLAYRIPSVLEPWYRNTCSDVFCPLLLTLQICSELEMHGERPRLAFNEFALFVQVATR